MYDCSLNYHRELTEIQTRGARTVDTRAIHSPPALPGAAKILSKEMNMSRLTYSSTFCVLLFSFAGCNRAPEPPQQSAPSFLYEVRGDDGSSNTGMAEELDVTAGKNRLVIRGSLVTANGKSYGSVKNGDSVLLDKDGKLTVNGELRSPE